MEATQNFFQQQGPYFVARGPLESPLGLGLFGTWWAKTEERMANVTALEYPMDYLGGLIHKW